MELGFGGVVMNEVVLKQVYDFVKDEIGKGISPSMREIGEACNISFEKASEAVSILEVRGKIEREEGVHRSIRIVAH
jgi:SOS-response transcriptional repressor LexA